MDLSTNVRSPADIILGGYLRMTGGADG